MLGAQSDTAQYFIFSFVVRKHKAKASSQSGLGRALERECTITLEHHAQAAIRNRRYRDHPQLAEGHW